MAGKVESRKSKHPKPMGITTVRVQGYKSIRDECSLEIRPLTILAGANSSGKSSAMQPLLLLKQTLEASYDPGALLLDGPNVRLASARQALWRCPGGPEADTFSVGVEARFGALHATYRLSRPKKGFKVGETRGLTFGKPIILRPDMSSSEVDAILKALPYPAMPPVRGLPKTKQVVCRVRPSRGLLWVESTVVDRKSGEKEMSFLTYSPGEFFVGEIRGLIHVPGLRGNPERTYKTTGVGPTYVGTFEAYVASIIAHWQSRKSRLLKELEKSLNGLGLTWKVRARPIDDTQVEIQVARLPHAPAGRDRDLVSIADVGFGVSQTLPVLVAILAARPGQLVYLEQPEIHLHPRAQYAMAQILVDAARRGVTVVAETHSGLLLRGVQALVAEGKLAPEMVKLHWFQRGEDGATRVSSGDLDASGAFGDWPEDFGAVELTAEGRYLDAVESRRGTG